MATIPVIPALALCLITRYMSTTQPVVSGCLIEQIVRQRKV
jgi:hypothetical protein